VPGGLLLVLLFDGPDTGEEYEIGNVLTRGQPARPAAVVTEDGGGHLTAIDPKIGTTPGFGAGSANEVPITGISAGTEVRSTAPAGYIAPDGKLYLRPIPNVSAGKVEVRIAFSEGAA
jgi:hypothetical protein